MTRGSRGTPKAASDRDVTAFVAKFEPAIASLLTEARATLRQRYPTAIELVYDNYNALAIGFGTSERLSDVFVSLAGYAGGVNLYFMYGATLPDPTRILQGSGTRGRFVRLDTVARLDDPAVRRLLRAAVAGGDTPLSKAGGGYTIVKSVSPKQRPRRRSTARRPVTRSGS